MGGGRRGGAWRQRAAVLACALAAAGCGRQTPPPAQAPAAPATPAPAAAADGAARARALSAASAGWPTVAGRWGEDGRDASYVARLAGAEPRYVEETGPGGVARYWFEGGTLFYYEGERPAAALPGAAPGGPPANVPVVVELAGGRVVRAVSHEHYGEKTLEPATVERIRRHAQALYGAARDEAGAPR
jgi:hypothetical protein